MRIGLDPKQRIFWLVIGGLMVLRAFDTMTPNAHYGRVFYRYGVDKEKRDKDSAIVLYQKALSYNASLSEVYYRLGMIVKEEGRLPEAIGFLEMATYFKPGFHQAHNELGLIYQSQGQYYRAVMSFWSACKNNPQDIEYMYNRGHAFLLAGNKTMAFDAIYDLKKIKDRGLTRGLTDKAEKTVQLIDKLKEHLDPFELEMNKAPRSPDQL